MGDPLPDAPAQAPGMKPWLRVLLGVSLAMNLLVVGLVLGAVLRFGGPGDRPPPPTGVAMFRALPFDDRRDMRNHLREALLAPSDRRTEAEDLAGVLSADPFDEAALLEVLDQHAIRREAFQDALRQAWLGHVNEMSARERNAYAERLVEYSEHGKRPGHGDDRREDNRHGDDRRDD